MARVKTAKITRRRHKKVLKQAKGYFGAKHYRFRNANQAVLKSLSYAYVGRKDRKSDFRKLWIARINAAARLNGTTYSKLIAGLKKANVSRQHHTDRYGVTLIRSSVTVKQSCSRPLT